METTERTSITIEATVNATPQKVWNAWITPADIIKWASPSPEWHTPRSEQDVRVEGKFLSRMEARDGSFGFDFGGTYTAVNPNEYLEYKLEDGRMVKITFKAQDNATHIIQTFDAENENPIEMQRGGWQAILDNFKNYIEGNKYH